MSVVGDFRADLVDAFAGITANVYDSAPPAPAPPAIVLVPGDPWMVPAVLGGRLRVENRTRIMCAVRDSRDNLAQLETLVESVLVALPDGVTVTDVTAPESLDTGAQGTLLVAEVRITAHLREA